ncbi:hypothetical protein [Peribacillus acanthi]|uniref:hypothetical protein n=1 Tax=Peribacillus acanthi TaxID=2171554 RepID=UPI000D3E1703|nr:hypothetical protein [Peribacillus acanthi]
MNASRFFCNFFLDIHLPSIIQSLERVLTYDFQDVFCSHAGLVKDGHAALERKRDYLLTIEQNVLSLHNEEDTAEEICNKLFPKKYPIIKLPSGEWDILHIVTSIINENNISKSEIT